MEGNNKFIKDTVRVISSNFFTLLKGVVITFVLPKVMTIDGYADYKVFTLLLSYIGLFHCGLLDGINIKYAGRTCHEIGEPRLRMYSRFLIIIEIIFCSLFLFISFIFCHGTTRFVVFYFGIDIILHNLFSYFQMIFQITMDFKKYFWSNITNNILQLIGVFLFALLALKGYNKTELYLGIYLLSESLCILFCACFSLNIIVGKSYPICDNIKDIIDILKKGMLLLVSGIIAVLILNLDRQFVLFYFTKADYSIYSFTYSVLQIVITVITSLSIVLYPSLRVMKKDELAINYNKISFLISTIVFGSFNFEFFFEWIIKIYLPHYQESIFILKIILPVVVLLSIIQIVLISYFKALDKGKMYFFISLVILGIGFILNIVLYNYYNSLVSIAFATICSFFIWMYMGDFIIRRELKIRSFSSIYILLTTMMYYVGVYIAIQKNTILGNIIYFLQYILGIILINLYIKKVKTYI